ncbi:ABC transporter permease [Flexivirga oryzae]|uniref:Osmoprotectant transport system permease protein n=1 Tax=Flexivirga oryzae TaxID=1794944 RepID=A0A839N4S6_9MICO|nr:ABC transporter permease [Flexivirga oryzae]MBB2890636.1 osmoprotectant transport system permease protein [Flexivirga oryzae]
MSLDVDPGLTEQLAAKEATGKKRGRLSGSSAIELFGIPVLVIVGFLLYVWWRQTATLDSIEASSLNWTEVRLEVWQHIKLTVVASVIVVLIAVPLGIALTRPRIKVLAPAVVGVANAGQAAPSIGLIVLLFMWLSGWSGFWVAILALALYGILPVLRNTITGIQGVDPTLVEAGRGLGWSNATVLLRVELPLALPVIMAGVRTSLVLVVGTAALATFINAGGMGGMLTAGITLYRYPVMVAGAVLIALLALLVEWVGRVLELLVRPKGI